MDSMFSNLWQRLARLDGGGAGAVEGKLSEGAPVRRDWRVTVTGRGGAGRGGARVQGGVVVGGLGGAVGAGRGGGARRGGRMVVEDERLRGAVGGGVGAAGGEDPPRMRTTALGFGENLAGPGPPEAGGARGRGAQQGEGTAGQERDGEPGA